MTVPAPLHTEAKHHKLVPLRAALLQAATDADAGNIPWVAAKDDRSRPLALLFYDDFLSILKEWHERGQKCAHCGGGDEVLPCRP